MSVPVSRRSFLSTVAIGTVAPVAGWPSLGAAQSDPPIRQLTIVVAFPAGGATDSVARLMAEGLTGSYAKVVIVENRAGASGRIGTTDVKRSRPDGSTLLFTPAFPMVIFPHIYKKLDYDTLTDFVPVATTSKGGLALAVGPAVPDAVATLPQFVQWCKANPGKANFGTASGSSQHFAGVTFARAAGIELPLISYKGGAPAVIDLLGGHIASTVSPMPEVLPFSQSGKLRILATMGTARSPFTPDVPTMIEAGYRDVVFQDWSGFLAPAKTPAALVTLANDAVSAVARSPKGVAALAKLGAEADAQTPEQFGDTVRASWERYRGIVQSTGFKAED